MKARIESTLRITKTRNVRIMEESSVLKQGTERRQNILRIFPKNDLKTMSEWKVRLSSTAESLPTKTNRYYQVILSLILEEIKEKGRIC